MLVTRWLELQETPVQWHGVESDSVQVVSDLVGSPVTAALSANSESPSEFNEDETETQIVIKQKKVRRIVMEFMAVEFKL